MLEEVFKSLEKIHTEMVMLRRDFHRHPELGFQEIRTPQEIAAFLKKLDLEVQEEVGGRGVLAKLKGGKPGKTVALRADFDALPLQEETNTEYKSCVPGVAHACGHDFHTAALLGTAKILKEYQQTITGNVVFIFQHAEEMHPGGAEAMINDRCLEGVDVIYGAHITTMLSTGMIGIKENYMTANSDSFEIELLGNGGHAAFPHLSRDPLVTASQLVVNLQQVVSRWIDPLKPAVLTVSSFHSGTADNVIPAAAKLSGTVRTFDEDVRDLIEKVLGEITLSTAKGAGLTAKYLFHRGYPATWNTPVEAKRVEKIAKIHFGDQSVITVPPIMGGEDFARYAQKVPGAFFAVGARNHEPRTAFPAHHPSFDADEVCLLYIGKLFLALTIDYLSSEQTYHSEKE